jgi:hypothetical protein
LILILVKYAKFQQQFFEIYQTSYIQLRTIEQQRLLAIREQMRFAMNVTMNMIGKKYEQINS